MIIIQQLDQWRLHFTKCYNSNDCIYWCAPHHNTICHVNMEDIFCGHY